MITSKSESIGLLSSPHYYCHRAKNPHCNCTWDLKQLVPHSIHVYVYIYTYTYTVYTSIYIYSIWPFMNNYIHVTIHASYIPWPPSSFTSLVHCWPCPSPGLRVLQGAKMIVVLGLTVSGMRCHRHLWIVVIHPKKGESLQCSVPWENVHRSRFFWASQQPTWRTCGSEASAKPVLLRCGETLGLNILDAWNPGPSFFLGKADHQMSPQRGRPSLPFSWRYTWASKGQNWAFHIHYLAKNFGLPSGNHGNWKWLLDYAGWNNHLEIGRFHHCFRPLLWLKLGTSGS